MNFSLFKSSLKLWLQEWDSAKRCIVQYCKLHLLQTQVVFSINVKRFTQDDTVHNLLIGGIIRVLYIIIKYIKN